MWRTLRAERSSPRLDGRVLALAVVSLAAYLVVRSLVDPAMTDFAVYRAEGDAIRSGIDLYGHLNTPQGFLAVYPPFAAICFVPISLVPWQLSQVLANAANLGLMVLVARQSCRLAGLSRATLGTAALALAAVCLWAEPVNTTLGNGQINLALLALVLSDFTRPEPYRWRGVGIGIAAGLKVTPGVFIVYLLLTRRWRAAATALAAFAATLAVSAAVVPSATWRFWTRYLFDTQRVGADSHGAGGLANSTNQSMQGLLARATRSLGLGVGPGLAAIAALVALAGLAVAVLAHRRAGDAWGVPSCAVAGLLGSPIAWTHHWVWCVPITVLLVSRRPHWAPVVLIFWTFAVFYFPHSPPSVVAFPDWKLALTNWYVLFGVVFLALAATARGTGGSARQPALARAGGGHGERDGERDRYQQHDAGADELDRQDGRGERGALGDREQRSGADDRVLRRGRAGP